MTKKDYQNRAPLRIFFSYFKPHKKLFALDMLCAFIIALIDLAFPLVSRTAMYQWLPDRAYTLFFAVMAAVVAVSLLLCGGVYLLNLLCLFDGNRHCTFHLF